MNAAEAAIYDSVCLDSAVHIYGTEDGYTHPLFGVPVSRIDELQHALCARSSLMSVSYSVACLIKCTEYRGITDAGSAWTVCVHTHMKGN